VDPLIPWEALPPALRGSGDDPEVLAMGPFLVEHEPSLGRRRSEVGVQLEWADWDGRDEPSHDPSLLRWASRRGGDRRIGVASWRVEGEALLIGRTDGGTSRFSEAPDPARDSELERSD
jgi:hypothetical protein